MSTGLSMHTLSDSNRCYHEVMIKNKIALKNSVRNTHSFVSEAPRIGDHLLRQSEELLDTLPVSPKKFIPKPSAISVQRNGCSQQQSRSNDDEFPLTREELEDILAQHPLPAPNHHQNRPSSAPSRASTVSRDHHQQQHPQPHQMPSSSSSIPNPSSISRASSRRSSITSHQHDVSPSYSQSQSQSPFLSSSASVQDFLETESQLQNQHLVQHHHPSHYHYAHQSHYKLNPSPLLAPSPAPSPIIDNNHEPEIDFSVPPPPKPLRIPSRSQTPIPSLPSSPINHQEQRDDPWQSFVHDITSVSSHSDDDDDSLLSDSPPVSRPLPAPSYSSQPQSIFSPSLSPSPALAHRLSSSSSSSHHKPTITTANIESPNLFSSSAQVSSFVVSSNRGGIMSMPATPRGGQDHMNSPSPLARQQPQKHQTPVSLPTSPSYTSSSSSNSAFPRMPTVDEIKRDIQRQLSNRSLPKRPSSAPRSRPPASPSSYHEDDMDRSSAAPSLSEARARAMAVPVRTSMVSPPKVIHSAPPVQPVISPTHGQKRPGVVSGGRSQPISKTAFVTAQEIRNKLLNSGISSSARMADTILSNASRERLVNSSSGSGNNNSLSISPAVSSLLSRSGLRLR